MTQNRLYADLNIAVELARIASSEIREIYYGSMEITDKEDGTPVTNADLRANEIIVDGLQKTFPQDGIVSEELATVNGGRVWYIDPIDGTRGFTYHNDQFAIHIGLVEGGQPVLGVVYKPTTDEYYSAIKGEGAFRNGQKLEMKKNKQHPKKKVLFQLSYSSKDWEKIKDVFDLYKRYDLYRPRQSMALGYCYIASNYYDAGLTFGKDSFCEFAGSLIISEAGGKFTNKDGSNIINSEDRIFIAGEKKLYEELKIWLSEIEKLY